MEPELSGAAAVRARFGRAAGRGAGPAAGIARLFARNLDRRLGARERFLERDLEVVAQIGAALRTATAAASAEDVAEPRERARIESARADAADAGMAEPIVGGALFPIAEHRVRLGRLLELV